jgi:hypothetical protein
VAAKEDRAYTQCGIEVHLSKRFVISLAKPSDVVLDQIREHYALVKLTYDDDRDLIGGDGKLLDGATEVIIREIGLLTSREIAAATVLGGTTDKAMALIEDVSRRAFGASRDALIAGTTYLDYQTTTKLQFSNSPLGLFGADFRALSSKWTDIDSLAVVAPMNPGEWPPTSSAMVHAQPDYWEKYFGKGAPKQAFVVPSDLDFYVYLPTRFFKMTKYRIRISVESVEDYLENKYFLTTELPYLAHMSLANSLDQMIQKAF